MNEWPEHDEHNNSKKKIMKEGNELLAYNYRLLMRSESLAHEII